MIRIAKLVCATSALMLPAAASAGELAPLQAGTFGLRDHTASVYYTLHDGAFEVVTTIAPNGGPGAPARQVATISVGSFATGVAASQLRLERTGDMLSAEIVPEQHMASR